MPRIGRLIRFAMRTANDRIAQCPPGKRWIVTSLFACNTSASALTFRLHHVIPPETAATTNAIFYDVRVAANTTTSLLSDNDRIVLRGTEDLQGLASAANLTVIGYGYEEDDG